MQTHANIYGGLGGSLYIIDTHYNKDFVRKWLHYEKTIFVPHVIREVKILQFSEKPRMGDREKKNFSCRIGIVSSASIYCMYFIVLIV